MSELTIEQRVAAGVAWLDENRSGWIDLVNLDTLDLSSCTLCVLGQLFGEYEDAPLAAKYTPDLASTGPARSRGFEVAYRTASAYREYADLTAEWRRVIESRRAVSS